MIPFLRYEAWVRTRIISPEGKIVKEQKFKSKSFLRNYAVFASAIFAEEVRSIVRDGGTVTDFYGELPYTEATAIGNAFQWIFSCRGLACEDSRGILVGAGDTPVSPEDYNLADKIYCWTEAGYLDYRDTIISAVEVTPDWSRITIKRTFINVGGVVMTVREIGLMASYVCRIDGSLVGSGAILIVRDVLPTPDDIPDGYTYEVVYEFKWMV